MRAGRRRRAAAASLEGSDDAEAATPKPLNMAPRPRPTSLSRSPSDVVSVPCSRRRLKSHARPHPDITSLSPTHTRWRRSSSTRVTRTTARRRMAAAGLTVACTRPIAQMLSRVTARRRCAALRQYLSRSWCLRTRRRSRRCRLPRVYRCDSVLRTCMRRCVSPHTRRAAPRRHQAHPSIGGRTRTMRRLATPMRLTSP